MFEDAQEILKFLPIRRTDSEDEYIDQLRGTFELLEKSGQLWSKNANGFAEPDESLKNARPFALMPFHLLFMMALQYKVLRIADLKKDATNLFFSTDGGRYKTKLMSEKRSVFDLTSIKERTLPEIFQLVGLSDKKIGEIKDLIDKRNNNLAHANGNSTGIDLDGSIFEYLNLIKDIQDSFLQINHVLAEEWISEIQPDDNVGVFIESRLLTLRLNSIDLGDIISKLIELNQMDYEQWEQVVNKGLDLVYEQTIFELKYIETIDNFDVTKKAKATNILQGIGESSVLSIEEAQDIGIL